MTVAIQPAIGIRGKTFEQYDGLFFCHRASGNNNSLFLVPNDFTAPNRAAVIVGTAVGSLLLIVILLVFIGLLYWKMSSRFRHEKEFSNEIRYCTVPRKGRN